ncbi:hypothetical protein JZ751_008263 [Albula glossodonta]|uniref:Uncharacterized protein n=1 Tax=Albula glossodonta TaxID=121402 RepID=A0A8T2N6P8_9TELE|nr:hypothetical protein JZ751_008263 [Albula glossodonta]
MLLNNRPNLDTVEAVGGLEVQAAVTVVVAAVEVLQQVQVEQEEAVPGAAVEQLGQVLVPSATSPQPVVVGSSSPLLGLVEWLQHLHLPCSSSTSATAGSVLVIVTELKEVKQNGWWKRVWKQRSCITWALFIFPLPFKLSFHL